METTTITTQTTSPTRRVAINALAVVGFVVLIILGMAFAIYAATFVPKALTGVGGAAVYLSSIFVPTDKPAELEVVTPGDTVPFPEVTGAGAATTTPVAPATIPAALATPVAPTPAAGQPTATTYTIGTAPKPTPVLTGLPDLTVAIVATGYLTSSDTSSFIKSDTVPDGLRGAIKFSISNIGTNASGRFDFEATLPTTRTYTFTSDYQNSLLPGEKIEYVLGFDRTRSGDERTISVDVDEEDDIKESNENNNSDSKTVRIK